MPFGGVENWEQKAARPQEDVGAPLAGRRHVQKANETLSSGGGEMS